MLRFMQAAVPATIFLCLPWAAVAQQTPIVKPNTVDTPIPPLITVPGPPVPADVPNRPLTADEAAQIALRLQPNVAIARAALQAAQGRTQQAKAGLLPSVPLSAGFTHIEVLSSGSQPGEETALQATQGFSYSASVHQLIFDFNHTRDLVRQAARLELAAAIDLTRVQSDLVLSVKQAFYTYVEDTRLVAVDEGDVENRKKQLALANARLNTGIGLPNDVATAEAAVAQSVLSLNVARNSADLARVNLALILGIDPRTPIQVGDAGEPTFASTDVNALVNTALKSRPEIREAEANLQASRYAVNAARSNNLPAVTGSAGIGSSGTGFVTDNSTFTVGAAVQFTPFDGGLTAGLVKTARANYNSAQANLIAEQLTVKSDVAQAYFGLRNSEQEVSIADIEVKNATEEVRIAEGRYKAGLGLFQDIITAEAALLTARTDRVTVQYNVDASRATISHAIGNPIPTPPARP